LLVGWGDYGKKHRFSELEEALLNATAFSNGEVGKMRKTADQSEKGRESIWGRLVNFNLKMT
jgi:hypothetical protein